MVNKSIYCFFISLLGLSLTTTSLNALAGVVVNGSPNELKTFLKPKDNIIFLRAEAEDKIKSNEAIITLKVMTQSTKLAEAITLNRNLRIQIRKKLLQSKIDGRNIQSSKFSIAENNNWIRKNNNYKIINRLVVTVLNGLEMKSVATIIDTFKEVELISVQFKNSNQDEFENQVRAKAVEKILQQKSFFEKKLNLVLKPISFRQSPTYRPVPLTVRTKAKNLNNQSTKINKSSLNSLNSLQIKSSSFDEKIYKTSVEVKFLIQ